MDFDLDDLISTDAANTAKAGLKFQPKGKPKPKPKPKAQQEQKPTSTPSTQVVEIATTTTEEQTENDANQIIGSIIDSLQSLFEKPQEVNAESSPTLDSLNDFLPKSTTVNLPPYSETQTNDVSIDKNLEAGPTEPELINNIDASANLESIATIDSLTEDGSAILHDIEIFQIENLSPRSKEAWGPPDILTQSITGSGPRVGKFKPKPKPKAQTRKIKKKPNNPDQDVGPAQNGENICSVSRQIDIMENEPDEIQINDSAPTEPISDYNVINEEPNKSLRLVDEADNEGIDDNNTNKKNINNNDDGDDDYVPEDEPLIDKNESKSKSKKPVDENKKPVRKRKKASEVQDEITEVPKKKFKHSTKRNKRQVNPELLKLTEDELEMQMINLPLRDLIRLREHNEKIEKKEASLAGKDTTDPSDSTHYNYRTHMKITPRMRWTKVDTELFYQALQQFGQDLSIIKQLFPDRTLEQIRLKYKKEEKQNRLRIESALTNRAKDYSYYECVIERLKQAKAEDSENEDPITLAEEEDENNEGGNVELQNKVKDMEKDDPAGGGGDGGGGAGESPTKSDDIEDDFWSHYKSDI